MRYIPVFEINQSLTYLIKLKKIAVKDLRNNKKCADGAHNGYIQITSSISL